MDEREAYDYVDDLRNGAINMIGPHATGEQEWVIETPPDKFDRKIREIEDAVFDG